MIIVRSPGVNIDPSYDGKDKFEWSLFSIKKKEWEIIGEYLNYSKPSFYMEPNNIDLADIYNDSEVVDRKPSKEILNFVDGLGEKDFINILYKYEFDFFGHDNWVLFFEHKYNIGENLALEELVSDDFLRSNKFLYEIDEEIGRNIKIINQKKN